MDIVLDNSSIVNFINGSVFDKILTMPNYNFFIGEHLFDKEIVDDVQKIIVEAFITKKKIQLLSSKITLSEIVELQKKYHLGLGEIECIALCKNNNMAICTDDKRARKLAMKEIGEANIVGSLSMLKDAVKLNILTCEEALTSYKAMIDKGAFLPKELTSSYFCQ